MERTFLKNKTALQRECVEETLMVNNLPYKYGIHLNMFCNQSCIMCMPDARHPRKTMSFEKFEELFNQIKPFAEHITLIGGEPLIYSWINEVIDLLSQHKIVVTINTNATNLSESLSQKLLSLHELNLKCSIHAPDEHLYWKIHGSKLFKRVEKNITFFSNVARNMAHIKQIFVYVIMKENLQGVLSFIDFAKSLSPHRIEFHPVEHVMDWQVENNTGWHFNGKEQSPEFIRDEYNRIVQQAAEKCEKEGIPYEVSFV